MTPEIDPGTGRPVIPSRPVRPGHMVDTASAAFDPIFWLLSVDPRAPLPEQAANRTGTIVMAILTVSMPCGRLYIMKVNSKSRMWRQLVYRMPGRPRILMLASYVHFIFATKRILMHTILSGSRTWYSGGAVKYQGELRKLAHLNVNFKASRLD